MKIHLVDGPAHGNTMQVESDPPEKLKIPVPTYYDYRSDNDMVLSAVRIAIYVVRYVTVRATVVYEFAGME